MCEQVRAEDRKTCQGGTAVWFLAGAVAGVAIGLLYAPRSGRATRDAISGSGREWYDRSRDILEQGRQLVVDAAELFERGRRMASGGVD